MFFSGAGWGVWCVLAAVGAGSGAGAWNHLGAVGSCESAGSVLLVHCGEAAVQITAVSGDIIRVRLLPTGVAGRDFSWAVQDVTARGKFTSFEEAADQLRASTGSLTVIVDREPCRLTIRDGDGRVLVADEPARGMGWRCTAPPQGDAPTTDTCAVRVWQELPHGTAIYGLGEKTGPLDKVGRAWTLWNSDTPAYGEATDPLYKSVPFFISERDGRYHGVFFDNPWRSSFDFGQLDRGVASFGAEGGELNYYVIAGPHPKDVIRGYSDLTGCVPLPPKWALGYHQCRYSYYPESRVREIAATFRDKQIPCDVIYFDIDYMDGYRSFTWHPQRFSDPNRLMADLHAMGFHAVTIIDPGIKNEAGYFVYDQGSAVNAWLTRPDGKPYVGRVWPGPTVFPDFTSPKVRDWWAGLFPPFVASCGVDGIWNDMNEPADFDGPNHSVPLDLRHDNEGQPAPHAAVHNVYGMQMARATFEGLKRARPDQRPFTITRATYAGGQRYGACWTGDNISSWEHLRMSISMVAGAGVSGLPFIGPDIGGFVGGATPELYARWIQAASLFPFCRTHTAKGNPDQEPWSFGPEVEAVARQALERRYAMLPYLYTMFEEASRTGLPIVRPLWLEFPAIKGWWMDQVFMVGSEVLVLPTIWPGARDRVHWLPPGVWFDGNTGLIHAAGQPVNLPADLQTLPHFVRAGAILPMQSLVQTTASAPSEPLILDVWPLGESEGWLYEDDGATFAYTRGEYRRTRFTCRATGESVELTIHAPEGGYTPPARSPLVRFHGLCGNVEQVALRAGERERAVTGNRPGERADLPEPGDFRFDEPSGTWQVRMCADDGRPQHLSVKLSPWPPADGADARVDFTDADSSIAYANGFRAARDGEGVVRLDVEEPWDPYIVLRRFRFPAGDRPMMTVRLASEHAARLAVRFATEQDPLLSDREGMTFDIQADGRLHEYSFDLSRASEGAWTGTVYWVRLDFENGVAEGERIILDDVAFHGRSGH